MDLAIEAHMRAIFAGKLPTTDKEISSRLSLRLGINPSFMAKDKRGRKRGGMMRKGRGNGPQMMDTKASDILKLYFRRGKTMDQCLLQLEGLI